MIFGNLFRKKEISKEKLKDSLSYFFYIVKEVILIANYQPLSESEKFNLRNKFIDNETDFARKIRLQNYSVWFFSRIELEASNFTIYNFEKGTLPLLPLLETDPHFIEVKRYLEKIL